jgi:hypothetical protein
MHENYLQIISYIFFSLSLSPTTTERSLTLKKYTLNATIPRSNGSHERFHKIQSTQVTLPSVFSLLSLSECFIASVSPRASMPPPLLDPPPSTSCALSSSPPPSPAAAATASYPLISSIIPLRFLFRVLSSHRHRHHRRPLHALVGLHPHQNERCVGIPSRFPSNSIRFLCDGLAIVVDVLRFVQVE